MKLNSFVSLWPPYSSMQDNPPTQEGVEYTLLLGRCHYTLPDGKAHYTLLTNRAHYIVPEDD